ncbi:hypothetical protein C8R44DRAFT_636865, partial [Mycena epipterygia]
LQPAFILAGMALAILLQSSDAEKGRAGREQAAFLREAAGDALERTWRDGVWVDGGVVEAALLVAIYESSAHPEYHPDRLARAIAFLDEAISALGFTAADAARPDVCRYARGAAPVVDVRRSNTGTGASTLSGINTNAAARCTCLPPGTPTPPPPSSSYPSSSMSSHGHAHAPNTTYYGPGSSALPWDPRWSAREVKDEEVRRVCWSALGLVTGWRMECLALGRGEEEGMGGGGGYLLLFPNEVYDTHAPTRHEGQDPRNAIWALYCRSMLVTNFCCNIAALLGEDEDSRHARSDAEQEELEDRESEVDALQEAWNEVQAIQDALDAHVCGLHTAIAYLCREHVSKCVRIVCATELTKRSLQGLPSGNRPGPLFNRRQAEEWIYYQAEVIKRVTMSLQYMSDPRGHPLAQRPYAVTWFYHQLAICLLLWENDTALTDALALAKSFLVPLDVMNALWPCPLIELQCTALRKRLAAHCRSAGHEPPPPATYKLPGRHDS